MSGNQLHPHWTASPCGPGHRAIQLISEMSTCYMLDAASPLLLRYNKLHIIQTNLGFIQSSHVALFGFHSNKLPNNITGQSGEEKVAPTETRDKWGAACVVLKRYHELTRRPPLAIWSDRPQTTTPPPHLTGPECVHHALWPPLSAQALINLFLLQARLVGN